MELWAKVASVISPTQIAINVGSNKGISIKHSATIFRDVEIKDPDGGAFLGSVKVPILRLRVNTVQDKFCLATVTDLAGSDLNSPMVSFGVPGLTRTKTITQGASPDPDVVRVSIGQEVLISD